jgi:hypothetical protein
LPKPEKAQRRAVSGFRMNRMVRALSPRLSHRPPQRFPVPQASIAAWCIAAEVIRGGGLGCFRFAVQVG